MGGRGPYDGDTSAGCRGHHGGRGAAAAAHQQRRHAPPAERRACALQHPSNESRQQYITINICNRMPTNIVRRRLDIKFKTIRPNY